MMEENKIVGIRIITGCSRSGINAKIWYLMIKNTTGKKCVSGKALAKCISVGLLKYFSKIKTKLGTILGTELEWRTRLGTELGIELGSELET